MFNNKLFYFGAAITLCGGLTSCAVDACSFDSDYKKENPQGCMLPAIVDTGLSVIPKRISLISGGTLLVADKQNPGTEVYLSKAGELISIGHLNNDGELRHIITPSELAKLSLGEIQLSLLNAVTPRSSIKIRVYIEPNLPADKPNVNYSTKITENDVGLNLPSTPVMIGITSEPKILLLSQNTPSGGKQTRQYSTEYSANAFLQNVTDSFNVSLLEKTTPGKYSGFSQSKSGFLFVNENYANDITPSSINFYSASGPKIIKDTPVDISLKNISFLCADIDGKMTGAIVNGSLSFFNGQSLDKPIKMNHGDNKNASIATLKFGIGDLDGDQNPDVAIWYDATNTISVYTLKGDILEWSPDLSKSLQAKSKGVLGQSFPTAVRLADIDRDGVDDIILADGERLIILPNDGTGDYETPIVIPAIGSGVNALGPISAIAVGQLGSNPKSLPSLALVSSQAKKIAVVLNQSTE